VENPSKPNVRFIIGVIVTQPLGEPSRYRTPMTLFPFMNHICDGQEEPGVDATLTLEDAEPKRTAGDRMEIVTGSIQHMRNQLVELEKAPKQEARKPSGTVPEGAPTTIIQLCVGSAPFADLFAQVMARFFPINVDLWLERFRAQVAKAKPDDVIWVDIVRPDKVHHPHLHEMWRKAIPHMVA
jgi:hypothetical protein